VKFRFETILLINKNKEDVLLKELGMINTHLQKQEDRKHFMQDASEKSREELDRKVCQEISAGTIMLYNNFASGVKIQSAKQKNIVAEIHSRLEAKRKEIVAARKKRRIMELLKERDALKHDKTKLRRETFQMDEIASNAWQRNS